jgi:hypothetical protein
VIEALFRKKGEVKHRQGAKGCFETFPRLDAELGHVREEMNGRGRMKVNDWMRVVWKGFELLCIWGRVKGEIALIYIRYGRKNSVSL